MSILEENFEEAKGKKEEIIKNPQAEEEKFISIQSITNSEKMRYDYILSLDPT